MPIIIKPEQKQKALKLYKNKTLTIKEISNLTNISQPQLNVLFRQAFEMGVLKPRREELALKPRTPNGQGKARYIATGKKRGNPTPKSKYTEEQEQQIAIDYYENDFTISQLKEKWGIHPMQLQRVRKKYSHIYGKKEMKHKPVLQFDKDGNFIAEFESGFKASKETNICYISINRCCNGVTKTSGGFVWKFKDTQQPLKSTI